jgi:hypothetical protein
MWLYCAASLTEATAFWVPILPTVGGLKFKRDA